jgi:hypothetical protein
MVVAAIETTNTMLDDLLDRIGRKLQLSETAHQQARDRYKTIADWLSADGSEVAQYAPHIYTQGSLRIGTTVKPRGRDEYDLDLVCEFRDLDWRLFPVPEKLLDLVENRLRENGTYRSMVERKNRCIRITYANQFHMDILAACPNPTAGLHCVVVPDCAAQCWKDSNPKGYALWFEHMAEEALVKLKRNAEPLPSQTAYDDLVILKRAVQLIKRYRDIAYEKTPDLKPISIVLTTLAALNYNGQQSVNDAIRGILDGIIASIPAYGRLRVHNPTNKLEDLSERWEDEPELYRAFVSGIKEFRARWAELNQQRGIPNVKLVLEKMFGESVAKDVVGDYMKSLDASRKSGGLGVEKGSGIISVGSSSTVSIRDNTFYGGE